MLRIKLDGEVAWLIQDLHEIESDTWIVGRLETHGKTVTIEAVHVTDNKDPSYVAFDDIIFINDAICTVEPPGSDADTQTTTTDPNCFDKCRDGDGM